MPLGLMGHKKGMTQIFGKSGELIPVTVLELGPCTVVQKKEKSRDGYDAVQLGFKKMTKARRVNKPTRGFFSKRKLDPFAWLKEFRVENPSLFEDASVLKAEIFQAGDRVDVEGITKGRGFQGVIKRHGKHGGPDAHGSDFHRRPGSIGMRTWPGRVLKNMRLPGRMGSRQVLTRNLEVVSVVPGENLILVQGAVPGARNGRVILYNRAKDFETRFAKKEKHGDTKENNKEGGQAGAPEGAPAPAGAAGTAEAPAKT